jgi:hypothetical protein
MKSNQKLLSSALSTPYQNYRELLDPSLTEGDTQKKPATKKILTGKRLPVTTRLN